MAHYSIGNIKVVHYDLKILRSLFRAKAKRSANTLIRATVGCFGSQMPTPKTGTIKLITLRDKDSAVL